MINTRAQVASYYKLAAGMLILKKKLLLPPVLEWSRDNGDD